MTAPTHPLRATAAVLGLLTLAALGGNASAATDDAPAFPDGPLLLVRELLSPLADGGEIVGRRTYAITIRRDGTGWRIDGSLVDSEVDAPPSLRAIAEIERRRPDTAMFPLRLDDRGHVLPSGDPLPPTAANGAMGAAMSSGGLSAASTGVRQAAAKLVGQVAAMPLRSPVPDALFSGIKGGQAVQVFKTAAGDVTVEMREHVADGQG